MNTGSTENAQMHSPNFTLQVCNNLKIGSETSNESNNEMQSNNENIKHSALSKDELIEVERELEDSLTSSVLLKAIPVKKDKGKTSAKKKKLKSANNVQSKLLKYKLERPNENTVSNSGTKSKGARKFLVTCNFCEKEFDSSENLKDHDCGGEKSHSNVKTLKCKYCSLRFTQKNHLNKHVIGHKRNNCFLCNAQFTKRKALCKHLRSEHNIIKPEKIYHCSFCDKQFSKKPGLIEHLKDHANGQQVCLKCGYMCNSETVYSEHMKEHIKNSKFECLLCEKKFVRRQQYDQHMMGHEKHSCSRCSVTFSTKKLLIKHEQSVHDVHVIAAKKYVCVICKKKFIRPQLLRMHMRIHTGEKPVKCSHCEKSFRNNRSLSKHMKSASHLQRVNIQEGKVIELEKPFLCLECGARFYRQHSLLRHIEVIHSEGESFKCPHCEYNTKCKTNLKRHVELHTDIRRFICEICGLSFRALATLKEHHAFVHSENRCFTCSACDKSFKSKSSLQRHIKIHSEVRPYKCYCNRDFKRMSHLKRHVASVHRMSLKKNEESINSKDAVAIAETFHSSKDFLFSTTSNSNICSELSGSIINDTADEILSVTSSKDQLTDVPSHSIQTFLDKNNIHMSDNDPKSTIVSLVSAPSSKSPKTCLETNQHISNPVSLDDPSLNLSPSNFCNFNLSCSPTAIENETSGLQDVITPHDILSFSTSADCLIRPHSLPNLNFQTQASTIDAFAQFSLHNLDSAALQIQSFLMSGDMSSPTHLNDLNLEQNAAVQNFFEDSDDSLSLSPFTCNTHVSGSNCSSEQLFNPVRDIKLWDSGDHSNRLKLCGSEINEGSNIHFSANLASNANNLLSHNSIFSNESLMTCSLDANALNSDLDSLSNLC